MGRCALLAASVFFCGCGYNFVRSPTGNGWRQPSAFAPAPSAQRFDRVLIIVLENQDYSAAIADPYLGPLARRGASFTDFHGLFHPSYSNYLAMVSGRAIVTHFNRQIDIAGPTIADALAAKGLTWKNYAEGYPGHCFTGARAGRYARKHVPFLSFTNVREHACGNVVNAGQFAEDVKAGSLPNYAFYSPDLDHDGHDPALNRPAGLAKASLWLRGFLEPLLANDRFTRGALVIITFDESGTDSRNDPNRIYTVFLGPMVARGEYGGNYNHFNVLRTIEANFGLGPLAEGDGNARVITGVWR